ncbi:DUF4383 domain-containing protein [Kineococcus indalonis]|uniref:DUF4383 domain-containing protein n=1 Tax=Kineococcus indalonis TaxID=2696566 RepID=UPI001411DD85|nr:DUF4383 domain-containing protein [Kineococcus indalonis]NAZ87949.1 DUF4383 domain-containing protein [Kineococcus indalonis]
MATRTTSGTGTSRSLRRSPVQATSLVVGAVFVLVGVAGFVPGVTTDYDRLAAAGHHSGAMLLGLFQVSVLHNLLHLALGVVGVLAARTASAARSFLVAGGLAYAALWVYGLVVAQDSQANLVPLNTADDRLHLVLAVGMVLLGLLMPRRVDLNAAHHP